MNAIAIIPARGGSKRLPRKNLMLLGGVPLLAHSIRHARMAATVGDVIVSTDDQDIAALAIAEGAQVVMRPAELAGDTATSESALLHALDERVGSGKTDPDLVVFLQCTSPVRRPGDIDAAMATLRNEGADSLLSVCENVNFIWKSTPDGAVPINYDYRRRQREQDFERQYRENGSIYVFPPSLLRRTGNRLGGRIAVHMMDYWSSFQIDRPEDVQLCEWILARGLVAASNSAVWPDVLDLVVFDFDGVMTDNTVAVDQHGAESVVCHRGDGLGLERLRARGVSMLVLSKERNPVVSARCAKLQIACEQGVEDKEAFLRRYLDRQGKAIARTAYVGNDINDLSCLEAVGLPVVVADAHPSVLGCARLVLNSCGGRGAVREFCDLIEQQYFTQPATDRGVAQESI